MERSINYESSQRLIGWTNDFYLVEESVENVNIMVKKQSSDCPSGRRLAIILDNGLFEKFTEDRHGAQADRILIFHKFLELANYHIEYRMDLNGEEFKPYFSDIINNKSVEKYESVVIIMLTHGGNGVLFGVDDKPVILEEIFEIFNDCVYLNGKKKVFLINACRGGIS